MATSIKLPKKTKIAGWWMIIEGILFNVFVLFLSLEMLSASAVPFWVSGVLFMAGVGIFIGFLLSLSGFLILKRKKIGWICGVSLLFLLTFLFISFLVLVIIDFIGQIDFSILPILLTEIFVVVFLLSLPAIICLIPLIFLLREKKEFWKIVT